MWSTSCLLTHFPITVSVVSTVILQGQPPLGSGAPPQLACYLACGRPHAYRTPLQGAQGCPPPPVQLPLPPPRGLHCRLEL